MPLICILNFTKYRISFYRIFFFFQRHFPHDTNSILWILVIQIILYMMVISLKDHMIARKTCLKTLPPQICMSNLLTYQFLYIHNIGAAAFYVCFRIFDIVPRSFQSFLDLPDFILQLKHGHYIIYSSCCLYFYIDFFHIIFMVNLKDRTDVTHIMQQVMRHYLKRTFFSWLWSVFFFAEYSLENEDWPNIFSLSI